MLGLLRILIPYWVGVVEMDEDDFVAQALQRE